MKRLFVLPALIAVCWLAPATAAPAATWVVKAGADGNGSKRSPFGTLAEAQRASRPGDRILVGRSRRMLKGGIVLKRGQSLVGQRRGRGKPRISDPDGDAVVLANRTKVRGLRIVDAFRGGIYGENVGRVLVRNNNISGHNTSCTVGFQIPPFNVPTTVPGPGIPIGSGLKNGWAGIMVDARKGSRNIVIRKNRVHDSDCGDGIDVRAFDGAKVRATIARNRLFDLRQGSEVASILAIGLQTRDGARMNARVIGNRQSRLGNPGQESPEGDDSEGVFINPVGPSSLRALVARNRYTHEPGRGGFSANGLEFVTMGDGARGNVTVRDSTFSDTPGDILEQLALGTNGVLRMKLDNVTATGSTGFAGSGAGNTVIIPGNNGDCLLSASGGAGNVVTLDASDVTLTDCANNGLTFGSSVANGSGPTDRLRMTLRDSVLTGNMGNNLRIGNVTELTDISLLVERTDLSDANGTASLTPANASFEDLGSTDTSALDLGGGSLGSEGGNCLDGGSVGAASLNYDVSAKGNWWNGPPIALPINGTIATSPTLSSEPAYCAG